MTILLTQNLTFIFGDDLWEFGNRRENVGERKCGRARKLASKQTGGQEDRQTGAHAARNAIEQERT